MASRTVEALPSLFESDETAWLEAMAELIRKGQFNALDYGHLSEYLTDMARRDKREVKSRLAILIAHLLKWSHQTDKQTGSWRATITVQQQELSDLLESELLRNYAVETLALAYADGVKQAVAETGLARKVFPKECPYTLDILLAEGSVE
jgi:Domain of unknown function DUF29